MPDTALPSGTKPPSLLGRLNRWLDERMNTGQPCKACGGRVICAVDWVGDHLACEGCNAPQDDRA